MTVYGGEFGNKIQGDMDTVHGLVIELLNLGKAAGVEDLNELSTHIEDFAKNLHAKEYSGVAATDLLMASLVIIMADTMEREMIGEMLEGLSL